MKKDGNRQSRQDSRNANQDLPPTHRFGQKLSWGPSLKPAQFQIHGQLCSVLPKVNDCRNEQSRRYPWRRNPGPDPGTGSQLPRAAAELAQAKKQQVADHLKAIDKRGDQSQRRRYGEPQGIGDSPAGQGCRQPFPLDAQRIPMKKQAQESQTDQTVEGLPETCKDEENQSGKDPEQRQRSAERPQGTEVASDQV